MNCDAAKLSLRSAGIVVCEIVNYNYSIIGICSCPSKGGWTPWSVVSLLVFLKRQCPTWDTNLYVARISSSVITHNTFFALFYNMINPIMQNPISPAMELCICCGIAPPVTWLVGVVVFCDFVGTRLLAKVASTTLA